MITAIEGVSCTGKSTLASRLAAWLGLPVIGCYQHLAADPSMLGAPIAHSEAEQLSALTAHLDIEEERHRRAVRAVARDGGVILDRSVDTLLAHLEAIGRIQGLDAMAQARLLVDERVSAGATTVPDLTLLLTADPAVLAERATSRPCLPPIYYDPVFAEHFNGHFDRPISPRCVRISSAPSRTEVLDTALAHLPTARRA